MAPQESKDAFLKAAAASYDELIIGGRVQG